MRCTSYCTASSYELPALLLSLQTQGRAQLYRNALHLEIREKDAPPLDVFYFSYGTLVCWGLSPDEEKKLLALLKPFEKEPLSKVEIDEFTFVYGDTMKIKEDEIVLPSSAPEDKLAISYGIAQSVKLTRFEELIQKTIEHNKNLPKDLAQKGKILLSRKEISRKMGEIFLERNFINLHTEVLDTPEFFWENPELEPFYRRTSQYLEIAKRAEVLNKRLNLIHELFEILSNELNHQHSYRLEWTIIGLIVIEVVIALLRDLFHLI